MARTKVYTTVETGGVKLTATPVPIDPSVAKWMVVMARVSGGTDPVVVCCNPAGEVLCTCKKGVQGRHCGHVQALVKAGVVAREAPEPVQQVAGGFFATLMGRRPEPVKVSAEVRQGDRLVMRALPE